MSMMTFAEHKGRGSMHGNQTAGRPARRRRTRVPRIESLEDRTLLATLQFSGTLGEQSTLDSDVQAESKLPNLNTPATQPFPHNDGTAVSNVTLTTAASTTGNPGVNLDILSQGSVAKNGIASVAVNTGIADTSGNIGASIPVTIVASDSSEETGDPVNVQFAFSFNVKTFASNNATANFTYSVSFTYDGTTTPLASKTDQLGGSGVTPVGAGPVDLETATLHAKIGDTFMLNLLENLSGQTIAPYLGAGINNVGWLVDDNLDVSAAPPAPTSTTVTTDPAETADFGQDVDFIATVENTGESADSATPTGTVQFSVDGDPYGVPAELDDGTATTSDALLPVGTHSINADYTPDDPDFAPSSSQDPATLVVQADATATTVTTQPGVVAGLGQNVTFTATVANTSQSASPATPTGTIQFSVDGDPYGDPVALVDGAATTSDAMLSLGMHSISADYTPDDPDFAPSSSEDPATITIGTIALLGTTVSAVSGEGTSASAGTLTASLTTGGLSLAGQTLKFTLIENGNPTTVGSSVTNASGTAVLSTVVPASFNVGTFANFVSASYTGNTVYSGSSGSGTLTVVAGNYVEVTSNPVSQVVSAGNPVTFVAAGAGTPAPTVQWQVSTDSGNTFSNIAGATNATLTFTTTASQSGNEYRAAFTNSSGTATTAPATLTVNTTPGGLVISAANGVFPQFNLSGSDDQFFTLSTGNIVGDDPIANTVSLYNGETGALISVLNGASTVTLLTNGNFVATGNGSATWGSGRTGVSGTVSAANSFVFPDANGNATITPLPNGNYVVDCPNWDLEAGAVALGNGTTGTTGIASAANCLIGTNAYDGVGGTDGQGVTALANGNYVVSSPDWNNLEGAVTWGNGTTGVTGTISAANSLVELSGGSPGENSYVKVTPLTDGNYVVSNDQWNGAEGEATWGSGTAGVDGVISAANSLVGSTPDDDVGDPVTALTNGNYVVVSPNWNSGAGAVTWASGTMGIVGTISATNSLVGTSSPVGGAVGSGVNGGVIALPNGNYVVDSPAWNDGTNPIIFSAGAVTWGNGTTGTVGVISAANSLVGSNQFDEVGGGGVTALPNSNYVVASPDWNNGEGAATWGNGSTGTIGTVSATNSLVGSHPLNTGTLLDDSVSSGGITALTNGNYVVDSSGWNSDTGAVTWGNGTTGTFGTVSAANSLVGTYFADSVGSQGVTALSNGNYVVDSPQWGFQAGAVTWGDGTAGVDGLVSSANSFVGSTATVGPTAGDEIGGGIDTNTGDTVGGITALPNGDYVVISPFWNQSTAAVTWFNGSTETLGTVSSANSFTDFPTVAYTHAAGVVVLPNGNYVFWDTPGGENSNTWFDGSSGTTIDGQNTPDPQNTFSGGFQGAAIQPIYSGNLFIGGATVAITDPNELTYALGQGQTITVAPSFLTRDLDAGTNVTIQSNDDITIDSPITVTPTSTPGSLTLETGRSILINAGINTAGGNLSLIANDSVADGVVNSERDPGDADITMTSGATLDTGSGSLVVDLEQSTDKTNNGRGSVTLLGVTANAFTLPAGSTLGVSIDGTTPGDGIAPGTYSQLVVSGSIDLNNATLQVVPTTAIAAGTTFTIVQSGSGVTGVFNALPQGSVLTASDGSQFAISYQADGGDAVVLTALLPVVTEVSPPEGLATGGTPVTITGTGFTDGTVVDFGTMEATGVTVVNSTTIMVPSPGGTGTLDVTVATAAGVSVTSSADKFSYVAALSPPAVTGVAPATGPATGGTQVTITGTNLAGASAVDFGSMQVNTFLSDTASEITLSSPAGTGTVDVTVVTPAGTSPTSSADKFSYVAATPPAVTGVAPGSGPTTGGTQVTITGTNLTGASAVDFGSMQVNTFMSDTASEITLSSPADTGTVDVTVVTPAGTSPTSLADKFSYAAATLPAVTGVAPGSGPTTGGTQVTITGTNLAGASAVNFGSMQVNTFLSDTATEITLSSPAGTGTVDVTVLTPAGTSRTSSADKFSYVAATAPAVTGVAPGSGPTTGGTQVTITGSNLAGASAVDFGATKVTSFISDTATEIIVSNPAGAGTVEVTVVTPAGSSAPSSADQFSYVRSMGLPTNLSAVSGSVTFGGAATLTSTLTANGLPLAGKTITFTLNEGGTVTTVGTATTATNGVATLTGVSLAGLNAGSYSGAVGASFAGDSTYAANSAGGTLVVHATQPPPSPLVIIGEQPLFHRKSNKKGKPIGKSVLSGFVFDFSDALNPSSATTRTDYQVDTITTKRVKKQTRHILHPITSFSVTYSAANDSVTLTFAGKQALRTGGQITVVGGPSAGVTGASGAALAGNNVFTISAGGKTISPE